MYFYEVVLVKILQIKRYAILLLLYIAIIVKKSMGTGKYIICPFIPKVVQESKGSTSDKALEGGSG